MKNRLGILITDFDTGGVERVLCNLARGLHKMGWQVDFLIRKGGPFLEAIREKVGLITLKEDPLAALVAYLKKARPQILLTAKLKDDRLAILAKDQVPEAQVAILVGTVLSQRLREGGGLRRFTWRFKAWKIARLYRQADVVMGVSKGVLEDLAQNFALDKKRLKLVRNPVIVPELEALAQKDPGHPWLREKGGPVILSVGRLSAVKDIPTLIRAFSLLRRRLKARLIILGQGRQYPRVKALVEELGLGQDVSLVGFRANPYPFIARADLVALSSIREGLPTVLIEALALGTPVVSTDCPHGPREILAEGRYGPLVPVGDATSLAQAMYQTLSSPPQPEFLKEAARPYSLFEATRSYLEAFF